MPRPPKPGDLETRPPKPEPLACPACGKSRYVSWNSRRWIHRKLCSRGLNLFQAYGITCADFDKMLADQGGTCKLSWCERPGTKTDHDHNTGRVRGILCQWHNAHMMAAMDELFRVGAWDEILDYLGLDHPTGSR